jgi:hypothetical protein
MSDDLDNSFYEPFNIVTLAGVLGSTDEQEYAKKWIAELGNIVNDKEIPLNKKYTSLLDHLGKVKTEEKMKRFQEYRTYYGLHINFIHGQKSYSKSIRRILYVVCAIGGILAAIRAFL